jgi:mannose/fructose/N-acetylgalactosamine-specific phosphotransferase system component IID
LDQVQYWDVFPKSIKVSHGSLNMKVPLSIRGNPRGNVCFDVSNMAIATVSETGLVSLGYNVGATIITAYDTDDRTSVRYVQVEVVSVAAAVANA